MKKQLWSLLIGLLFSLGLGGLGYWGSFELFGLVTQTEWLQQIPTNLITTMIVAYFFFGGLYPLAPAKGQEGVELGVPIFLGSYVSWYIAPSGWSWWLPRGIGGMTPVDVRVRTLGRTIANGKGLTRVTTRENSEITAPILVPWKVFDPCRFVMATNPSSQLEEAVEQAFRHFSSQVWVLSIPHRLGEITKMIAGDSEIYEKGIEIASDPQHVDLLRGELEKDADGNEISKMRVSFNKSSDPKKRMAEIGIEIVDPSVSDIDLPEELVKEMTKKRAEEAQQVAQLTQAKTLNAAAKALKKGLPKVESETVLAMVLAADSHAKYVHVAGSDPFTRAAGLLTEGKE